MIEPHGGELVNRFLSPEDSERLASKAEGSPTFTLSSSQLSDVVLIANGAYSPLRGFLGQRDYEAVLDSMRLQSGLVWPLPIVLGIDGDEAASLKDRDQVLLVDESHLFVGMIEVEEIYPADRAREAQSVFRTLDPKHPGVRSSLQSPPMNLGGKIWIRRDLAELSWQGYPADPTATRRMFEERGWRRVVAFQTRNPIHRAHEYIQKCALEVVDGLFLHPLVGDTTDEDVPAEVRMRCYEALLSRYYPPNRVVMGVFPAAMRYAGPREAIFHALVRKNYGCTHFIVGRDHAGVGGFYGPYEAQQIFDRFSPAELGITPLFFDYTFWCHECGHMASEKTCPHPESLRIFLSGTKVRQLLLEGRELPAEFTRKEVAEILAAFYRDGRVPESLYPTKQARAAPTT